MKKCYSGAEFPFRPHVGPLTPTSQIRGDHKVELLDLFPRQNLDTPDVSKIINGDRLRQVPNLLESSKGQTTLGGCRNEGGVESTVSKDVPVDDFLAKKQLHSRSPTSS